MSYFAISFTSYLLALILCIGGSILFWRDTNTKDIPRGLLHIAMGGMIAAVTGINEIDHPGYVYALFHSKEQVAEATKNRELWSKFGPARKEMYTTCAEPEKWKNWNAQEKSAWGIFNTRLLHNNRPLDTSIFGEGCYTRN